MKVILKQDVKGHGKAEDMVNVSDGYARNYLLPRGIAVEASSSNLNVMRTRKDAETQKRSREREHAEHLAARISGITLPIKGKAGENNRLFGSITNKDLAEQLNIAHKIGIDKKKFVLDEPIKSTGEYEIEIKLYPGIAAKLKVAVEAE